MREPVFWRTDGGRGSGAMVRALLSPLGAIYAWAGARRIARTEPHHVSVPVICVGNLTLGGTGKTPVTASILERLRELGHKPHALSRGYGGRLTGPVDVDPDTHTAADTGDEPLLLARSAPVWISRNRPPGANAAVENGADVIVMDDGHQNPTLYKDFSIIVIDGVAGWGARTVFPAGPLREPVEVGLARADAVVVMMPGESAIPDYAGLSLDNLEIPVFHAWLEPMEALPDAPLVAFAGIGRPQKFFDSITAHGGDLREIAEFPDHHPWSEADLRRLHNLASRHDAQLITTEKDWVRLPVAARDHIIAWPVRARFANPAAFDGLLRDVMDGGKPGS